MEAAHNLPVELDSFVGRQADVHELTRLVTATRLVTLAGPGGIGKSRLASRVAAALAPEFPDGVRLVELTELTELTGPRRPAGTQAGRECSVTGRVARVLGVLEEPGRRMPDTLADAVGRRRMLLVLDNCESAIEECAAFAGHVLAACPRLRILATGREPLRVPGETIWRVPPLALPRPGEDPAECEAVRLFVERACAERPGFAVTDLDPVVRLCRMLDGMPLAIELAAAMTRVLSIEQIVTRMDDRFRLLSGGDRTAPARQRTLRATVDWSYELLGDGQRTLLHRLAVFTGGWTLEMAEAVCGGQGLWTEDVLGLLRDLVDKSLVTVDGEVAGEARYRMLETIREYAAERLSASGEREAVCRRHAEHMSRQAELTRRMLTPEPGRSWPEVRRRLALMDAAMADYWAAVARSWEAGEVVRALRMLVVMHRPLLASGRYDKAVEWLDRLLAADAADVPPCLRGDALVMRGALALAQGEHSRALEYGEAAAALCRASGNRPGQANAAVHLAMVDPARFGPGLDEAVRLARDLGDRWIEGIVLGARGSLALFAGRHREAQRTFETVYGLMSDCRNHYAMALSLIGLAQTAHARGSLEAAREHYETALRLLEGVDARSEVVRCLAGLGKIATERGDFAEARARLGESLRLSRDTGQRLGVARRLEAFALLACAEGDHRRSVRLAAASSALRRAAGSAPSSGAGARVENMLAPARARLGEAVVATLWAEGQAMTADQAIDHALEPAPEVAAHAARDASPAADAAAPPASPGATGPASGTAKGGSGTAGGGSGTARGANGPDAAGPADVPRPRVVPSAPESTLTPRELELVALVARGLSNRAIADELVISPATAARHVANILAKLGFSSRTQVAAWAVERGLAETRPR
ncbi:LuxR C-terminal-related transcriptional regulator [Bailinhaonella thermotolerans]|uniref:HTH luxR-type domain-containing protein n=1 Tax=Bailinhaonella thermotolerans TaxID=1070861 RepID=A0A3A4AUQ9_9ACTN|nr:LuxR C-terminal-related transcriptional regulator [Bailinhaonella thermotolerans]RJL32441.1 hypothetical protein D5H75_12945 [Bailinhaonella thermotolerans]